MIVAVFVFSLSIIDACAFSEDTLGVINKYIKSLELSINNDLYFSGEQILIPTVGCKVTDHPFSKCDISLVKTGAIIKKTPVVTVKPYMEYIRFNGNLLYAFPLQIKLICVNSNSSLYESYNVEWYKIGIGMGGNILKEKINFAGVFNPFYGWEKFNDPSKKFLYIYLYANFGYTTYKLDPVMVKTDSVHSSALEQGRSSDNGYTAGFTGRIFDNTVLSSELTFFTLEGDDNKYQHKFFKFRGGVEHIFSYDLKRKYMTGYLYVLYDSYELKKVYSDSKKGVSCGLNYHF